MQIALPALWKPAWQIHSYDPGKLRHFWFLPQLAKPVEHSSMSGHLHIKNVFNSRLKTVKRCFSSCTWYDKVPYGLVGCVLWHIDSKGFGTMKNFSTVFLWNIKEISSNDDLKCNKICKILCDAWNVLYDICCMMYRMHVCCVRRYICVMIVGL